MLQYPNIDPIIFEIGPLAIRWYSLAYIVGIVGGWRLMKWINKLTKALTDKQFEDILTWGILGIVLGGRLGYVLFYKPLYFASHPLEILALWQGGMSFHGGMIGTVLAIYFFCRKNKIKFFPVMDMAATAAPIGLCLGRIANFINGELYGRPTNSPLAMIFPNDPLQLPRYPSQILQAGLEGLLLFVILFAAFKYLGAWQRPRLLSGLFLIFYGIFRIIGEFFREPDANLGYLYAGATMGQLLCIPMILLGTYLVKRALLVTR